MRNRMVKCHHPRNCSFQLLLGCLWLLSSAFADKSGNERSSLCMWREFRDYRLLRPVRCGPNELRANAKAKPASDLVMVDTSFGTAGGSNSLFPTILFCNLLFLRLPGYLIEVICDVTQRSARES